MYKHHMGNNALEVETSPYILKEASSLPESTWLRFSLRKPQPLLALDVPASVNKKGEELVITLVNKSLDENVETAILLKGDKEMKGGKTITLTATNVKPFNDFDAPENIKPVEILVKVKRLYFQTFFLTPLILWL